MKIKDETYKKRALISVSDKTGLVTFAKQLQNLGYEIVSTGGTKTLLQQNQIDVTSVSKITDFPECLGGRVKTLHPKIFAGMLAKRSEGSHMQTLKNLKITPIDVVVVNLYPFEKTIQNKDHTLEQAIENIDVGGPSMIRAAAKNYESLIVITDVNDYDKTIFALEQNKADRDFRFNLAAKAFKHTANYDDIISKYFLNKIHDKNQDKIEFQETITLTLLKKQDLRYGENPHQKAAYYKIIENQSNQEKSLGIEQAQMLSGKELSYNNINDAQGAIALAQEFSKCVCVAVKHSTPCAVASGQTTLEAFTKAFESDPLSIFGGIVCFNEKIDEQTALALKEVFLEVVIAPQYSKEAFQILSEKKNLRILQLPFETQTKQQNSYLEFKTVGQTGMLAMQNDFLQTNESDFEIVTKMKPTKDQVDDLLFAMKVVKHVKSNAIVVAKNGQTFGIGGGQTSRIWAAQSALERAGEKAKGAVLASDAFFPFQDVVVACEKSAIAAIIQPGGSINDSLSISQCDESKIAMVLTNKRHFRH